MGVGAAIGGAVLGGVAGGGKAAQGTPDQRSYQDVKSSQQTTFGQAGAQEQALQQQSLAQYLAGLQSLNEYDEARRGGAQDLQNAAQSGIMKLLSGQSFELTPQEQAAIEQQRQATVGQATADVQKLLDENLTRLNTDAAARGVRGQALSELQGRALEAAAQQLGAVSRQASGQAAQQSLQMPYTRLAAQQPFLASGATLADQMKLQAAQNRSQAQNPILLGLLADERQKQGVTSSTSNQSSFTPGQKGSIWDILGGVMGGLGTGAKSGYFAGEAASGGNPWKAENPKGTG